MQFTNYRQVLCGKDMPTRRFFLLAIALTFQIAFAQEPAPLPVERSRKPQIQTTPTVEFVRGNAQGTKDSPIVIEVLPSKDAATRSDARERHEDKKVSYDSLIAYATVALALVTSALAYFTLRLWHSTKNLVEDAEGTTKKQLRAYVAMDILDFPSASNLRPPMPNVEIVWSSLIIRPTNYGQTPAHQLTIWKHMVQGAPGNYEHQRLLVDEQMLHPTQGYSVDVRLPEGLTSETFASWSIYGRFVYRDIFDQWWVTKFCYMCAGKNGFVPQGPYNKESGPYESKEEALAA